MNVYVSTFPVWAGLLTLTQRTARAALESCERQHAHQSIGDLGRPNRQVCAFGMCTTLERLCDLGSCVQHVRNACVWGNGNDFVQGRFLPSLWLLCCGATGLHHGIAQGRWTGRLLQGD